MKQPAFPLLLILAGLIAASNTTLAADQAGVAAAVHGQIQLVAATAPQAVGRQVRSGEKIYLGDHLTSGGNAGMQIMLLDETVFTIGPDSDLTIDQFVYDPATSAGKVSASVTKGVFRFISGKVARNEPDNMQVKVPGATIGIRGTSVIGRIDAQRVIIGLLGPGPANNTGDKTAGVDVVTGNGTGALRRPGWGVIFAPGQPPQVLQLPNQLIQEMLGSLGPGAPRSLPGAPGAGQLAGRLSGTPVNLQAAISAAGQLTAGAVEDLRNIGATGLVADLANQQVVNAIQVVAADFGDLTTFDQLAALAAVSSGAIFYSQSGVPLIDSLATTSGTYDFNLSVDFGSRTISGGFSNINVGTVSSASLGLPTTSFAAGGLVPAILANAAACGPGLCSGTAILTNTGTSIAQDAVHTLSVTFTPVSATTPITTIGAGIAPAGGG